MVKAVGMSTTMIVFSLLLIAGITLMLIASTDTTELHPDDEEAP